MFNVYLIVRFVIGVVLTEAVTEIVTKSEIFRPFRETIFLIGQGNWLFKWLHNLIDCGYCFSMWSGMLMSVLLLSEVNIVHYTIDWFIIAIILHRASNVLHNVIDKIHGK